LNVLKGFFAKCEAKLEYLLIEKLPHISDKHINAIIIIKHHGDTLKTLKIIAYEINISEGVMKRVKRKIKDVRIHSRADQVLLHEDFDILSASESLGIPWKENWYEEIDGLEWGIDEETFVGYSDDEFDYDYEYDYDYDYEYDYNYDYDHDNDDDADEYYDDFFFK